MVGYPWPASALAGYLADDNRRRADRRTRLIELVREAWELPFYRDLWGAAGIVEVDLDSEDVLARLPTSEPRQFAWSCGSRPPFGLHSPMPEEAGPVIVQFRRTRDGGASATPIDGHARNAIAVLAARVWSLAGVVGGDVVEVCETFDTSGSAWAATWGLELIGAVTVPASGVRATPPLRQLEFAKQFGVRALCCSIPALHALAEAATTQGYRLAELPIERILVGGRPSAVDRDRAEQLWQAAVFGVYDSPQLALWAGAECSASRRTAGELGVHVWDDALIVEIIDEFGQPRPPGQWGEIVETCWVNPRSPRIRCRTGLRGSLLPGPCACGLPTGRLLLEETPGPAGTEGAGPCRSW